MQTLKEDRSGSGQRLAGPLDATAFSISEEEGLFWKEKKIFQGNHSAVGRMDSSLSPWLLITARREPRLSWPPLLHRCLEKLSVFVGERKTSSFLWGREINGDSLREALLSTSRMKGSLLFEQASGKNRL